LRDAVFSGTDRDEPETPENTVTPFRT